MPPSNPGVALLADEVGNDGPGQEVVFDRLLDLLLTAALRTWFAGHDSITPAWFAAQHDPGGGQAPQPAHQRTGP